MNDTNIDKSINNLGQMNWQLVVAVSVLFGAFTTLGYRFISSVEKQIEKKDLQIEKLQNNNSLNRDMYMIARATLEEQKRMDSTVNNK